MNKYYIIFFIFIKFNLYSIPLPIDMNLNFGSGYNNNYFRFSQLELEDENYVLNILGDSDTFDSSFLKAAFDFTFLLNNNKNFPLKIYTKLGISDYQQSADKIYITYDFMISKKLEKYKWIKIGYHFLPNNYLRMYKDKDQYEDPYEKCQYTIENIFLTLSSPIYNNVWGKIVLKNSTEYYNPFFTEFDMLKKVIEFKIYNLQVSILKISSWLSYIKSKNISNNMNLFSYNNNRSYYQYGIGTSFKVKNIKLYYFDHISSNISLYYRQYESNDISDHLHNGRDHMEFILMPKIRKNINSNMHIILYYQFVERVTKSHYQWVEDLKSYSQHEFGINISINLIDFLYDRSY